MRTCRPRSASIAERSWLSTAQSMSPVTTTVLTKTSSRRSDSLSGTAAKGPVSPRSVYQSAIAQTTALTAVTSRCPKRKAAQMMNGMMTNVRPKPAAKTTLPTVKSKAANSSASSTRRGVQETVPGALQLKMSGAKISMPQASPCHQVHQFEARSAAAIG